MVEMKSDFMKASIMKARIKRVTRKCIELNNEYNDTCTNDDRRKSIISEKNRLYESQKYNKEQLHIVMGINDKEDMNKLSKHEDKSSIVLSDEMIYE